MRCSGEKGRQTKGGLGAEKTKSNSKPSPRFRFARRRTEHINDTSSYVNLLQYSVFLIFYCIVLFRQIDNSGSR
jgi:hypothetical protein